MEQESDISFLAPAYVDILENEVQIKRELREQPGRLQLLHGIVTDLFTDKFKFKGQNAVSYMPRLHQILQHEYSLEGLLEVFEN